MAKKNKGLSVFVALDRSGSMQGERWSTAITSLNAYISNLQKEKIEGEVSITAFDTYNGQLGQTVRLEDIADRQSIAYFEPLSVNVLHPGGGTPLYDAAATVMDRAIERNSERTVIVILTDGEENASKEYTQAKIKDKVKSLQDKSWEVIFLGANFDVARYTQGSGLASTKMRNVNMMDAQAVNLMYTDLSSNTIAYARTGAAMDMSGVSTVKVNVKV
jgi:Mg-chelatase subunit ChlD